jgi:hypothetical protein
MYLALDDAKHAFYTSYQGADETNPSYMSKFKNTIEVIQHYGGNIGDDKALFNEELKTVIGSKDPDFLKNATDEEVASAKTIVKQKARAIAFLKRADKARYGLLVMEELENQFTRGTGQYSKNVTPETYNLLVNYKKPKAPSGTPGITRILLYILYAKYLLCRVSQEGGTQDTRTGVPKANAEAPVLPLETN